MKKIIFASMALMAVSCSDRSDDPAPAAAQDFTNAEYIKTTMQGTWKYWGFKSPSCNCWVDSGTVYDSYYIFTGNNYTFKDIVNTPIQNGTYTISPATSTTNASLSLTYTENGTTKYRYITLKALEGNTVTIYESSFDERFVKQ